jgi:hypothetical protein
MASTATGEDEDLEALIARIPTHHPTTTPNSEVVKCCCGRTDCAFLKHNCSALDDLEKEVRTAAQLGQVRAFLVLRGSEFVLPLRIVGFWSGDYGFAELLTECG